MVNSLRDLVELVKERVDIADLVSEYVNLRRSGRGYKALCPFHQERTPSFYVSPDLRSFHCFGCGKHGDVITFLQEMEGLTFREALLELARRCGIEVKGLAAGEPSQAGSIGAINEEACSFFKEVLFSPSGRPGLDYLRGRGVDSDRARLFELGFAPLTFDALVSHLRKKGFGDRQILLSGLAVEGRAGLKDLFRGRVIFPIRGASGRLLGFGGRSIQGEEPKYLNTPSTPLFDKSRVLYPLNLAREHMRRRGRAILVEGYMDALTLHLFGFGEAVASLGTALSEEQSRVLLRTVERVYLCYDADLAGQKAALRGLSLLLGGGLEVRAVRLPEGHDPDSFVREFGPEAFLRLLEESLDVVDFLVVSLRERFGRSSVREVLESISPLFSSMDDPSRELALRKMSLALGVSRSALEGFVVSSKVRGEASAGVAVPRGRRKPGENAGDLRPLLLYLWHSHPGGREALLRADPELSFAKGDELLSKLVRDEELSEGELEELSRLCALGARRWEEISFPHASGEEGLSAVLDLVRFRRFKEEYEELRRKAVSGMATAEELLRMGELSKLLGDRKIGLA